MKSRIPLNGIPAWIRRKIRQFFYSTQRKIILAVTLMVSVLIVGTFAVINQIIKQDRYESLSERYTYLNDKILSSFDTMKNQLDELTGQFILNDYVQKTLTKQTMTASDLEMMEKTLSYYNKSFLDYYLVIDNEGKCYSQRSVSLEIDKFKNSVIYKSLGDDYSRTKIIWARDVVFGTSEMSFFAVRYIRNMNTNCEPGVLILKLNDNILSDVRDSIVDDSLAYFILDSNREVCFSRLPDGEEWDPDDAEDRSMLWEKVFNEDGTVSEGSLSTGIVSARYDESTEFTIITYAPREVTITIIHRIQSYMLVVFLLAYFLAVVATVIFSRNLTRPIRYVSDKMSSFDETRLDDRIELKTNTEMDQIGNAYNKMVVQVKNLMEDVKQKESDLRESELDSLMYQIRPHFLYNTLDTIYMLARIQKEETIMKMIQSLSRFLRINLSNGNEKIEVQKELEHVSSYLEIQKIRNADLFTYEIWMDENVAEAMVMKMILQPVAENCIKYGFRNIDEGGKIVISACQEENYLVFTVMNNGDSIELSAMEKLNQLEKVSLEEIDHVVQQKQGGYGICNVVKRLRMRYNGDIRFYYEQGFQGKLDECPCSNRQLQGNKEACCSEEACVLDKSGAFCDMWISGTKCIIKIPFDNECAEILGGGVK